MRQWLNNQARQGVTGSFGILVVLFLIYLYFKGGDFGEFDLQTLCMNVLPLVCIALGQYFVVLVNGLDLSLGPVMSVSGSISAIVFASSVPLGIVLALLAGLFAGVLNGILVVRLRLPPILATLATMSVFQGIALILLPSPGGHVPAGLTTALTGAWAGVPVPLLLLVAVTLVTGWIMSKPYGLCLRAIGGDTPAARSGGLPVSRATFFAYVLGGLLAALGGLYLAIATASGSPTVGDGFILLSVAAVVLGGVSIGGGKGAPIGVVLGALIIAVIGRLLYFADLSSYYQSLINGLILIGVVGIEAVRSVALRSWREKRA